MNNKFVDIILYNDKNGPIALKSIVDLKNNTVQTTQKLMAELFKKDVTTISKHINNIFKSEELVKMEVTFNPNDSKIIIEPNSKKQPILYNLDAIISVGFRVNSPEAVRFRRWAVKVISNYIIKGFALDIKSLIDTGCLGVNYFDELFDEVREIKITREF